MANKNNRRRYTGVPMKQRIATAAAVVGWVLLIVVVLAVEVRA